MFGSMGTMSLYCYVTMLFCSELASVYCLMVMGAVFGSVVLAGMSALSSSMKGLMSYLVVQVMGSNFVLVGMSTMEWEMCSSLVFMGFMIKIGLFPFHYWVYYVFCQLGWWSFLPGMVLFKVGLVGSMPVCVSWELLTGVLVLTFIQGVVGVASEGSKGSLKGVVSWISVSDSGWSVLSKVLSINLFVGYSVLSAVVLGAVTYLVSLENLESTVEMGTSKEPLGVLVALLSYGGMPPFLGCVMKVYIFSAALEGGGWCLNLLGVVGLGSSILVVILVLGYVSMTGLSGSLWRDKSLGLSSKVIMAVSAGGSLLLFL